MYVKSRFILKCMAIKIFHNIINIRLKELIFWMFLILSLTVLGYHLLFLSVIGRWLWVCHSDEMLMVVFQTSIHSLLHFSSLITQRLPHWITSSQYTVRIWCPGFRMKFPLRRHVPWFWRTVCLWVDNLRCWLTCPRDTQLIWMKTNS